MRRPSRMRLCLMGVTELGPQDWALDEFTGLLEYQSADGVWVETDFTSEAITQYTDPFGSLMMVDPFGNTWPVDESGLPRPRTPFEHEQWLLSQRLFDGQVYNTHTFAGIQPLESLIDGFLFKNCTTRLYGPSGSMKSFVGIDMGLCITTGIPWYGQAVKQGRVLYIAAEGEQGLPKRVKAWEQKHGLSGDAMQIVTKDFQVVPSNKDWADFLRYCVLGEYALIVFDTQARVTRGVDENDNTAFGEVLALFDEVYRATKACVLIIHHTGVIETRARGNTGFKGGLQTELKVQKSKKTRTVTVINDKQKDSDDDIFMTLAYQAVPVNGFYKMDGVTPDTSVIFQKPGSNLPLAPESIDALYAVVMASGEAETWLKLSQKAAIAWLVEQGSPSVGFDKIKKVQSLVVKASLEEVA